MTKISIKSDSIFRYSRIYHIVNKYGQTIGKAIRESVGKRRKTIRRSAPYPCLLLHVRWRLFGGQIIERIYPNTPQKSGCRENRQPLYRNV